MPRCNTAGITAFLVLLTCAVAFGNADKTGFSVQSNRTELTTGIMQIPSNPPTPASIGAKGQLLWEDFESSTFPPAGWDTLNLNEGYGWFLGTYSGGGTQAALVTWDQTEPVTLQNEWLITPELDFSTANSNLRLEFYMLQGYTYPHDFKVYLTTNDGGNWTEIFDSYGTGYPTHQWWFVSVSLTSWIGIAESVRIGFQYYGTDADIFGLDNVEITDANPPIGRCCLYDDPFNPECLDNMTQYDCNDLEGSWTQDLNCTTSPCPILGTQIEPCDDMYTDPDEGSGHSHPIDQYGLWTADYDGAGHHERIMLKWDLSAFEGETADSAFINIYRYFRCPGDYYTNCDLYVITEDWDEDTWDEYTHISHGATAFNTYNFGPALDWFRVDISDVAAQWLDGSIPNYGIVIQAQYGEKWSKFYSREGTYSPYLELYGMAGVNQCPVLDSIGDQQVRAQDNLELTVMAGDPNQTIPALYCENLPTSADFIDNGDGTAVFEWTPTVEQMGNHALLFFATDGELADSEYVTIQVLDCCDLSGDANNDGVVNVSDAVRIINYVFIGGDAPNCMSEGDANGDGVVNVSDAVRIINYVFIGGDPPEPCP